MVTLIPIEPISGAHGMLIVEAFSKLFINGGGQQDGYGTGNGYSTGTGGGGGRGGGGGFGDGGGVKCPEEWRVGP
jgi:hypothetical protein